METGPEIPGSPVPRACMIVCEKESRWAIAVRRELALAPCDVRVHQTRTMLRCWEQLAQSPESIVLLAADHQNVDRVVDRIAGLGGEYPLARAIVLADRDLAAHQWLFREAGALHVALSTRLLAPVVRLARRHLAGASAVGESLSERIVARLPWDD